MHPQARRSFLSLASTKAGQDLDEQPALDQIADPTLMQCFAPPPEVESALDLWLVTTERLRGEPRIRALMDFLAGYFATAKYKGVPPE